MQINLYVDYLLYHKICITKEKHLTAGMTSYTLRLGSLRVANAPSGVYRSSLGSATTAYTHCGCIMQQ